MGLTIVVGSFLFSFKNELKTKTLLIVPYFIWLCIATSLNAYILFNN
jgi:benzodiazapine receptor